MSMSIRPCRDCEELPPVKSRGLMKASSKLDMLYLHFQKTNVHQTWQSGDFGERSQPIKSHDTFNTY